MEIIFRYNILLVLVILASAVVLAESDDKLVSVAVLHRHGIKGPGKSYPNDPYLDSKYWPNGVGQLLDQGKLHQFQLGQWLRKRYSDFISERYHSEEVLVRSSDGDRTLMSTAANLAGLFYPSSSSEMWQEGLAWDPVPIHTVPQDDDEVVSMSKNCDKFQKLYAEVCDSEYFKEISKEHESIFSFVALKSGWKVTDISTFQNLYSVFYIYRMTNSSFLPDWAFELNDNEFSYLAGLSPTRETFTTDLQRLKVGPFFNYLNNHFNGVINGTKPKFLMMCSSDTAIAAILNTFGVYDNHLPEFCSTVIWELRENQSGNHYLNIFYKRNSTANLEQIVVNKCDLDCEYDKYKNILQTVTLDSTKWKQECSLDQL